MSDVLKEADKITDERGKKYGHPSLNFKRIIGYWNLWLADKLKEPITEEDHAMMMIFVKQARGLFLRTLSTMLVGHSHRTSQHAEADWKHKQTSTWATGCLCELNPAYWRIGNRWNWGAAFVEVDSSGDFNVENFRIGPGGEVWR